MQWYKGVGVVGEMSKGQLCGFRQQRLHGVSSSPDLMIKEASEWVEKGGGKVIFTVTVIVI